MAPCLPCLASTSGAPSCFALQAFALGSNNWTGRDQKSRALAYRGAADCKRQSAGTYLTWNEGRWRATSCRGEHTEQTHQATASRTIFILVFYQDLVFSSTVNEFLTLSTTAVCGCSQLNRLSRELSGNDHARRDSLHSQLILIRQVLQSAAARSSPLDL